MDNSRYMYMYMYVCTPLEDYALLLSLIFHLSVSLYLPPSLLLSLSLPLLISFPLSLPPLSLLLSLPPSQGEKVALSPSRDGSESCVALSFKLEAGRYCVRPLPGGSYREGGGGQPTAHPTSVPIVPTLLGYCTCIIYMYIYVYKVVLCSFVVGWFVSLDGVSFSSFLSVCKCAMHIFHVQNAYTMYN